MNLDHEAMAVVKAKGPNMTVPWILMGAFLYYHRDVTILTDGTYDDLTRTLKERWREVTHRHKRLLTGLTKDGSSTLYNLREPQYPLICRSAAIGLAQRIGAL